MWSISIFCCVSIDATLLICLGERLMDDWLKYCAMEDEKRKMWYGLKWVSGKIISKLLKVSYLVPGNSWLPFNKSFCWKTKRSRCIRGFVSQIKNTPLPPPQKNSSAKKRMSISSFRSSRVIYFKSSKANNKVNFTLLLSGKKFYTRWTIYPKFSLLEKDCIQAWKVLSPT